MERRDFIKMLGLAGTSAAAYTACSTYMSEALAGSTLVQDLLSADPHCVKGSLKDIEHVVILMQENRSFDHYYGTLRGVRGFGDPRPVKLKNGEPIWHQSQWISPGTDSKVSTEYTDKQKIRPYRLPKGVSADTDAGDVFLSDPPHMFGDGHLVWNNGLSNKWHANGIVSMAHYVEPDIPLYFQLAKAFTICDAYHCSVNGPTDPNRSYFFTGTSNSCISNHDFSSYDDASPDDDPKRPDWKTYPERLEELNVDWKFYQDGLKWNKTDPFSGNYGDNTLEFFKQYRHNPGLLDRSKERSVLNIKNQSFNSVLPSGGKKPSQFAQDIIDDKLPSVSWIVPPEAFTEHPKYPPHFGEYYLSEILRALLENKEVWHKTALLITYDENGGFFDHVLPPVPPMSSSVGVVSPGINLSVSGTKGDFDSEVFRAKPTSKAAQIGLGIRVPMLVISPWTTGGRVCSETFDHTSVIKFLEAWHKARGIEAPDAFGNMSSWRQAITGDLTSAFDFDRTKVKPMDKLVDSILPKKVYSRAEKKIATDADKFKPKIADVNADPDAARPVSVKQDQTQCDLLPIGYDFQTLCSFTTDSPPKLKITFRNRGKLGASFTVLSYDRTDGAWLDTVEGVKAGGAPIDIFDAWNLDMNKTAGWSNEQYSYAVHGPNGYMTEFRGDLASVSDTQIAHFADIKPSVDGKSIEFVFENWPTANGKIKAISAYTAEEKLLDAGTKTVSFTTKDGWYDISFVDALNSSIYLRRYAGHVENGKISKTDPAIGLKYDEATRIYVPVTV